MSDASQNDERISIGRIPLKQVRVKRTEESTASSSANPMNKLVPYLDLFVRLEDDELSRLAGVDATVVATLRKQVIAIDRALAHYVDLLPRLGDDELVRLTGATAKTIRFWRLCQPRTGAAASRPLVASSSTDGVVSRAASAKATTGPMPVANAEASSPGMPRPPSSQASSPGMPPASMKPRRRSQAAGVPRAQPHAVTAPQSVADPQGSQGSQGSQESSAGSKIPMAAQAVVSEMMEFSGDPFPGYDGGGNVAEPEEIALGALDEEEDPLTGL